MLNNNLLNQIAWQAAEVATMYSVSVDERVMISYFFELQVMVADPKLKIEPDVLFRSSKEPAQSLLVQPIL